MEKFSWKNLTCDNLKKCSYSKSIFLRLKGLKEDIERDSGKKGEKSILNTTERKSCFEELAEGFCRIKQDERLKKIKKLMDECSPVEKGLIISCLIKEDRLDYLKFLEKEFVTLSDEEKIEKMTDIWNKLRKLETPDYSLSFSFSFLWKSLDQNLEYTLINSFFSHSKFKPDLYKFYNTCSLDNLVVINNCDFKEENNRNRPKRRLKEIIELVYKVDNFKKTILSFMGFAPEHIIELNDSLDYFLFNKLVRMIHFPVLNDHENKILSRYSDWIQYIRITPVEDIVKNKKICGGDKIEKIFLIKICAVLKGYIPYETLKKHSRRK